MNNLVSDIEITCCSILKTIKDIDKAVKRLKKRSTKFKTTPKEENNG